MLRGFATVNYWADDLAAAKGWYAELLGVEPYFERSGYYEFRVGDYQHELGLVDRRYAPGGAATGPGGAVLYWHVDDVAAVLERLLSMGAKEYQPLTQWGEAGFVTASVAPTYLGHGPQGQGVTASGLLGSKVVEAQAADRSSTWVEGRAAGKTRAKGPWTRPRAGSRKPPGP